MAAAIISGIRGFRGKRKNPVAQEDLVPVHTQVLLWTDVHGCNEHALTTLLQRVSAGFTGTHAGACRHHLFWGA
jgi:hypothetical protein